MRSRSTPSQFRYGPVVMDDVPARDLRNDVSAILRRVEAGEHLRITFSGRPVAHLLPLPDRPTSLPWKDFLRRLEGRRADPGLSVELAGMLPDTTDDLDWP